MENILTSGQFGSRSGSDRPQKILVYGLSRWHGEVSSIELTQNTRGRELRRGIAYSIGAKLTRHTMKMKNRCPSVFNLKI